MSLKREELLYWVDGKLLAVKVAEPITIDPDAVGYQSIEELTVEEFRKRYPDVKF